jgi:hypothetical protein
MRRIVGFAAAASALLIVACWYPFEADDSGTLAQSATGINTLDLSTGNGFVEVIAVDTPGIAISYTRRCRGTSRENAREYLDNIVVTDTVQSTAYIVRADWPEPNPRSCGCEFSVALPPGRQLLLGTSNGRVTVTGDFHGDVRSSNGAIELNQTRGPLKARTSNGAIRVVGHRYSLEAHTSNGAIDCSLDSLGSGDGVILVTSNGRVTFSVPAATALSFSATTSNGEVRVSGFGAVNYSANEKTHKAGTVNGGGAVLTITSSNGNIEINGR